MDPLREADSSEMPVSESEVPVIGGANPTKIDANEEAFDVKEVAAPPDDANERSPPPALRCEQVADSGPVRVLSERNANKEDGSKKSNAAPKPVKVPPRSIFGYSERYLSPTDTLVSPISKGLLARNRRPMRMLIPLIPPKALETTFARLGDENRIAN